MKTSISASNASVKIINTKKEKLFFVEWDVCDKTQQPQKQIFGFIYVPYIYIAYKRKSHATANKRVVKTQ